MCIYDSILTWKFWYENYIIATTVHFIIFLSSMKVFGNDQINKQIKFNYNKKKIKDSRGGQIMARYGGK